MSHLWVVLLLWSVGALSAEKKKFAVETTLPVSEDIQNKYPHVQFKTPSDQANPDIVSTSQRDNYFNELGLKSELSNLDEADKDVLFWRLNNSSIEKLKAKYPSFPPSVWVKVEKAGKK